MPRKQAVPDWEEALRDDFLEGLLGPKGPDPLRTKPGAEDLPSCAHQAPQQRASHLTPQTETGQAMEGFRSLASARCSARASAEVHIFANEGEELLERQAIEEEATLAPVEL